MQDDATKLEDQPLATKPVVEAVQPQPEPQPEQVIEPPVVEVAPEPTPEPIPEPQTPPPTPEPEPAPMADPTPPVVEETPPVVSAPSEPPTPDPVVAEPVKPAEPTPEPVPPIELTPEPPKEEPVAVAPPPPNPEPAVGKDGIPQKVLDLSPQELDAARRLWITNNIHSLQKLSTKARHTRKLDLLNQVESFVHANAPVKLSKVAYELNISEPKASDYLRILVKSGRIKATGQTTSRRYG